MSKQLSSSLSTLVCLIIILNAVVITFASSGYDSIECDPHSNRARAGRARIIESIPCDLSKQNYCNLPGEFYPWNAVKKFVYDNQGLVRRMYGDLRHMFVMQSELENEIDFEDIKNSADKYSKAFNEHNKHNQQRQGKAVKKKTATTTTKRGEKKTYRSGDTSEPHFRPAQRPAALNTKQRTKPPKVNEKTSLIDNLINSNVDAINAADETKSKFTESDASSPSDVSGKTTKLTSITSSSSTTPNSLKSTSEALTTKDVDDYQSVKAESDRIENETVDKAVLDLFTNISSQHTASSTSTSTITSTASTLNENERSEEPSITERNAQNSELDDEVTLGDEIISEILNGESDSTISVTSTSKEPLMTTTTEAQLFQDSMVVQAPVNRRGVNACPVKEEVVAPFWGNNTRGEVLALLNVYPFEQYINWEKCSHENEQMYCRKGCRCEQQYRLHRLLAYNPLDACRGIFSDWFRFPSCCICKCYDIPFDYRVTSRSPRGSENILDDAIENEDDDEADDDNEENDFIDDEELEFFDDSG